MTTNEDGARIMALFDAVRAQTPQALDETKRLVETLCNLGVSIFIYDPPGIKMPAFDLIELIRAPRSTRLAIQTVALEMLISHGQPDNMASLTYKEIERAIHEGWPEHEKALAEMGDYERQRYTEAIWPARKCFDASFHMEADPQSIFAAGHACMEKIFR